MITNYHPKSSEFCAKITSEHDPLGQMCSVQCDHFDPIKPSTISKETNSQHELYVRAYICSVPVAALASHHRLSTSCWNENRARRPIFLRALVLEAFFSFLSINNANQGF